MKPLPITQVCQRAGGELLGSPAGTVTGVSTDSRRVTRGDLFVALAGERHDGHAFLDQAFAGGAAAALAEGRRLKIRPATDRAIVQVRNTRRALGKLAAACRRDFDVPVVAVAGSNGKTTVKELLAALLREHGETLASHASYNNDVGVPLTLLALEPRHRAAVVEVGTNHPGELAALLELIRPDHGVLTSIGAEHLESFGDLEGVAREEGALAAAIPAQGRLFVNGDAPGLGTALRGAAASIVRVGWGGTCAWRITSATVDLEGTSFTIEAPRPGFSGEHRMGLLGRHQVLNATLALAAAAELGVTPAEARRGLAKCAGAPMRLERIERDGLTILNDAYNANADSMLAALEVLADVAGDRRTVAVLGRMAELGDRTSAEHARVGRGAAWCGVDRLLTVGPESAAIGAAARSAGLEAVREAADVADAAAHLRELLQPGDVVLLKASRAAALERLLPELRPAASASAPPTRTGKPCSTT